MSKVDLNKVLEQIEIESADDLCYGTFNDMIRKKCPGYRVKSFDYDDYDASGIVEVTSEFIIAKHKEKARDIQQATWCTEDEEAYMCVVIYQPPHYEVCKREEKTYWYIWDNEKNEQLCDDDGNPLRWDSLDEADEYKNELDIED